MSMDELSFVLSDSIDGFLAGVDASLPSGEGQVSVVYDKGHPQSPLRSPPLSARASLGLVASLWVAPTLKGRLRTSA